MVSRRTNVEARVERSSRGAASRRRLLTLLMACGNVAAFVRARGADRPGEMAVSGALAATRARVLGRLIAGGLTSSRWPTVRWACCLRALGASPSSSEIAKMGVPRLTEISLDRRVLGIGLAAAMLTQPGCWRRRPALRLSRLTGSSGLSRPRSDRIARHNRNSRHAFVLAPIAMRRRPDHQGAGLLTGSAERLVALDSGLSRSTRSSPASDLSLRRAFRADLRRDCFASSSPQNQTFPGVQGCSSVSMPIAAPG